MGISTHYWVIAFAFALILHALAGGAVWLAHDSTPASPQAPRGIMVALDSSTVGNSNLADTAPAAVKPVPAATPQPVAAPAPEPAAADTVAPAPVGAASPAPVIPQAADHPQAATSGAEPSASGVNIPVAQAVTIKAADTLTALEQSTAEPAQTTASVADDVITGSGAQGDSQDPATTYENRITMWIGNHKYYPQAARSDGAEGTVRLHIVIGRDGNVINVGIAHSSGNAALDQAAKDMVKRSEPLPAMTDDMLRTRMEIILPVNYTLSIEPDAVVRNREHNH